MPKGNGGSPETLRRHNRGIVLQQIFRAGTVSRTQIAEAMGLTGAAISRITRELLEAGLIREGARFGDTDRPGRRSIELELAPDGAYVIGFGAGAFEQWIQIANLRGECVARRRLELMNLKNSDKAFAAVADAANVLIRDAGIGPQRVMGLGIAIAGVVDRRRGILVRSPNLGWNGIDLEIALGRRLGLPIQADALHHALNRAEASTGITKGARNVLLVNAALGIGASIISEGRIVRGYDNAAGQIGHMPIAGADGLCTCGRVGCLDTVASGHAILIGLGLTERREKAGQHDEKDPARLLVAMERAKAGDTAAIDAFRAAGRRLGTVLCTLCSVINPEKILLEGPLAQVPGYREGVASGIDESGRSADLPTVEFSAKTMDEAAAWLALDTLVFGRSLDFARVRAA